MDEGAHPIHRAAAGVSAAKGRHARLPTKEADMDRTRSQRWMRAVILFTLLGAAGCIPASPRPVAGSGPFDQAQHAQEQCEAAGCEG